MALVFVAVVCWVGICVLAVGICVTAKRGDADLLPTASPGVSPQRREALVP